MSQLDDARRELEAFSTSDAAAAFYQVLETVAERLVTEQLSIDIEDPGGRKRFHELAGRRSIIESLTMGKGLGISEILQILHRIRVDAADKAAADKAKEAQLSGVR